MLGAVRESLKILYELARSPEARRLAAMNRDAADYIPWRAAVELFRSGMSDELASKNLGDFPDPRLAMLTARVLSDGGFGNVAGGRFRWADDVQERLDREPKPRTPEFIEGKKTLDRIIALLPRALATGERLPATHTDIKELRRLFASLMDNTGYDKLREWCILAGGLDKLPEGAVVVDVGAGIGSSTFALARLTRARIVSTDPSPENVEVMRLYFKARGLDERVTVLQASAEELPRALDEAGIGKADAALMIHILHWSKDPLAAVRGAGQAIKDDGFIVMMQATNESRTARAGFLLAYLLGSNLGLSRSELRKIIKMSGLEAARATVFPFDIYVLTKATG